LYLTLCLVSVNRFSAFLLSSYLFHPPALKCNMMTTRTVKIFGNKYWISLLWDKRLAILLKSELIVCHLLWITY
jgi:hypothetical protein